MWTASLAFVLVSGHMARAPRSHLHSTSLPSPITVIAALLASRGKQCAHIELGHVLATWAVLSTGMCL